MIEGRSGRCFAGRQKLERTRNIVPKAIEKGKIIAARNTEGLCGGVALAFFGQESAEERAALAATERLRSLRQRGRQGQRQRIVEPLRRIGKAQFAVSVLCQLACEAPVLPSVQGAHHALRADSAPGGGVISSEHPSAART